MSYVDRNLLNDERVLYRAHLSRTVFAGPALLLLCAAGLPLAGASAGLSALLGAVAAGYGLRAWARYASCEFALTDRRVIMKTGLLRSSSLEILLDRVESLLIEQSVAGRLLGYGSVAITGTGGTRDPFPLIADPLGFRRAVQEQLLLRSTSPRTQA